MPPINKAHKDAESTMARDNPATSLWSKATPHSQEDSNSSTLASGKSTLEVPLTQAFMVSFLQEIKEEIGSLRQDFKTGLQEIR